MAEGLVLRTLRSIWYALLHRAIDDSSNGQAI